MRKDRYGRDSVPADTTKYLSHKDGLCSDTSDAKIETEAIQKDGAYKNCDSFWKIKGEVLTFIVTEKESYYDTSNCYIAGKWWVDEEHTLLMVHMKWAATKKVKHERWDRRSNRAQTYTSNELVPAETVRFFKYERDYAYPIWRKVNAGDDVVKEAFENAEAVSVLTGLNF